MASLVFGRMCSIVFLAFTLKLRIQTLLSVAPTQFQQKRNSSQKMDHMENTVSCENVHTGLRQGQGSGPIVSYCVGLIPCIGFSPVPISVNKP